MSEIISKVVSDSFEAAVIKSGDEYLIRLKKGGVTLATLSEMESIELALVMTKARQAIPKSSEE